MSELERALHALRADVEWPATPDLAAAVPARAAAPGRRPRLLAAVLAAALLVPAGGAVALPRARDAVLDWLGLRNVTVRRTPALPPARRTVEAELGRLVSLRAAVARAGFPVWIPAVLGAPDRVRRAGGRVSLIYAPGPGLPALPGVDAGLVLTQFEGGLRGEYLEKIVASGTKVERVDVGGRLGVFFSGEPHVYIFTRPDGEIVQERPLLAGPTLVWEREGVVLRLETRARRGRAVRIARSVTRAG
jgi:hypothetical protein